MFKKFTFAEISFLKTCIILIKEHNILSILHLLAASDICRMQDVVQSKPKLLLARLLQLLIFLVIADDHHYWFFWVLLVRAYPFLFFAIYLSIFN